MPPESLKQGQELAIPTSAAVAVSTPVMTLALVVVRQKPGGSVPRLALARSLVPTRNTFLPPLHTHTTTMPTPLTLAEPRLPWELFLLQVPREPPLCVGGQGAQGTLFVGAKGEREPDKECEMRARPRTLTQLLRTKNMSTRVRTIIKNVLLNINCATSPPSKPIVSREQYTRVF